MLPPQHRLHHTLKPLQKPPPPLPQRARIVRANVAHGVDGEAVGGTRGEGGEDEGEGGEEAAGEDLGGGSSVSKGEGGE